MNAPGSSNTEHRRRAEDALESSSRIYRALVESIDFGLWICEPDGRNIYASDSFLKLVGMTQEECSGFGWSKVLHPDDAGRTTAAWKECVQTSRTWDREHRVRGIDGQWYPVLARGVAVLDEQGSVKCWAGINLDLRRIKHAESELQKLNEELEQRVFDRTKDLLHLYGKLKEEIAERTLIQDRVVRLNRLYSVRSRVSEAIVRVHDVDTLYRQVCRIIVEQGLFKMAWIGIADSETRIVTPAAQWGDTGGYLDAVSIVAVDAPEGKGPTGRAIYELKSVVCSDIAGDPMMLPWRDMALAHGFRSSAAFPIRADSVVVGALTVYSETPQFFSEEEIYLLESLAADISHAADAIRSEKSRRLAEEALRSSREQLRALSAHLLKAREEERISIGREIHDELGQLLTAANLELDRVKTACSPDIALALKLSGVSELIDVAIDHIQRICSELRPRVLDHLGLAAALEWQAAEFSEGSGIKCSLVLPEDEVNISGDAATALFRIVQEALTNVARHSGADEVWVSLGANGALSLTIRDNGRGITAGEITTPGAYGILGIRERVLQLGGTITIDGVPGEGTTIRLTVPMEGQGDGNVESH